MRARICATRMIARASQQPRARRLPPARRRAKAKTIRTRLTARDLSSPSAAATTSASWCSAAGQRPPAPRRGRRRRRRQPPERPRRLLVRRGSSSRRLRTWPRSLRAWRARTQAKVLDPARADSAVGRQRNIWGSKFHYDPHHCAPLLPCRLRRPGPGPPAHPRLPL